MSDIFEKLASCEQITEWINPYDKKLAMATGETVPNGGANLRDGWYEPGHDWVRLEAEIKRLVVPQIIAPRVIAKFMGDGDWNRITLNFSSQEDWSTCFPVNERTHIFTREGKKAWAAVGLCGKILGLAVFAQEQPESNIIAKIQQVPEEIFQKLTYFYSSHV